MSYWRKIMDCHCCTNDTFSFYESAVSCSSRILHTPGTAEMLNRNDKVRQKEPWNGNDCTILYRLSCSHYQISKHYPFCGWWKKIVCYDKQRSVPACNWTPLNAVLWASNTTCIKLWNGVNMNLSWHYRERTKGQLSTQPVCQDINLVTRANIPKWLLASTKGSFYLCMTGHMIFFSLLIWIMLSLTQ